jgi:hypothetical protein
VRVCVRVCVCVCGGGVGGGAAGREGRVAAPSSTDIRKQFVKINAEKSPFLCERLNIWMIPTVLLVKQSKTVHAIAGLDELGGDRFTTQQLGFVLGKYGVLGETCVLVCVCVCACVRVIV